MVDGLIVIDATGMIQYVNPGCEKLFKYASAELIGENVSKLMPAPQAATHDGHLSRHRDTRVKRIIGMGRELSGLKSDGVVFPMYLSVGEAEMANGVIFVGIIDDLTDKKRAEEMILHHQKLDAIGQLSGGIAHDFNKSQRHRRQSGDDRRGGIAAGCTPGGCPCSGSCCACGPDHSAAACFCAQAAADAPTSQPQQGA